MKTNISKLTASALLIAIGVVIPMVMPIRFVMEPVSFTLASHVALFLAMMISPGVAAAVAIGTTAGFFIGGFPIVIVLRAASHIVFALIGSVYLKKQPRTLASPISTHVFSLLIGALHGLCEVIVVSLFYFGGNMGSAYYDQGFIRSVILLVGLGSVVHSMVDFEIAWVINKVLSKQSSYAALQKS